jgi:acetyl esterase/lipase
MNGFQVSFMRYRKHNFAPSICKFKVVSVTILAVITGVVFVALQHAAAASRRHETLTQARAGFKTQFIAYRKTYASVPIPPADVLNLVHYPAPLGSFPAYISVPPTDDKRYPAIIWIFGGFDNDIDDTAWAPATPDDDQSARAFRQAGIVTMYPSRRGGNNNPGYIEDFYGEVNDILAAAKYLAQQPYVDPHRIYLGGHSTGGTLALLTAESTSRFRAVFSCGPVSRITDYGTSDLTFNYNNPREVDLRSPIRFLDAITSPTYIMEGTKAPSNIACINEINAVNTNRRVHCFSIYGQDHFSELAVSTPEIAGWIVRDTGPIFKIPTSTASPKM